MTEIDDDQTPDLFPTPDEPEDPFRDMRKLANKAPKLERQLTAAAAENADLKRRLAFVEAGLTLSDKQRAALLAAHDGEMTREALRATAAELKFIEPDEPDEAVKQREEALAGQARIAEAHRGATPPAPAAPIKERIAQAEADGDFRLAGELKAQQVAVLMRAGQPVQID